jgi:hypothetical protein
MFYIVETDAQIEVLSRLISQGCYVDVVLEHDYVHPKLNNISLIYVTALEKENSFIIPINHVDGINVEITKIIQMFKNCKALYTYNKKNLLYFLRHPKIIDINLLYCLQEYDTIQIPKSTPIVDWYYSRYPNLYDINTIIPLPKLYERCEQLYYKLKPVIENYNNMLEDPSWEFYNNTATNIYYLIEQPGLSIIYDQFNSLYQPGNTRFNILDNVVYTSYNSYNSTSRPTNSFNGVNFAAIPKKKEFRQAILSKQDYLVEFDFDGYHVRLLGELVGHRFSRENIHQQLGRLYFNKEHLSPEEYNESKRLTFQIIYGGVPEKWKHIDFFQKVEKLTYKWWEEYINNGIIRAPISNKPFTKKLKEMSPTKLMNYILQSVETSRNLLIMKQLLDYLKNKKTKIVLYTYDSILIDFNIEDKKQTLNQIVDIMEEGGKYPVKYKHGVNLGFE